MPARKVFTITESASQIRTHLKASSPMIAKRLHALLLFKQHEDSGISKREVAQRIGVNYNSVQAWRTAYIEGGLQGLISHRKTGFKPSVITMAQQQALSKQLHNGTNGFVGFIELLAWFNDTYGTAINYKTFHGFVVRTFGAKIKTARKVHIKKNAPAVEAFKKTSAAPVRRLSPPSGKRTPKPLKR